MNANPNEIESRRKYTAEFKQDAVNRVLRTGKSCAEVGRELGINPNILSRWRREALEKSDSLSTKEKELKPSETAEMLRQARKEIEDLREQRDILKKALGIFSHPSKRDELS
jgi:transposase